MFICPFIWNLGTAALSDGFHFLLVKCVLKSRWCKTILGGFFELAAGACDHLKLDLCDLMERSSREDLKLLKSLSLRRHCWSRSLGISKGL